MTGLSSVFYLWHRLLQTDRVPVFFVLPFRHFPFASKCSTWRSFVSIARHILCKLCYKKGFLWPIFSGIMTELQIVLVRENMGKRKPLFYYILCSYNMYSYQHMRFHTMRSSIFNFKPTFPCRLTLETLSTSLKSRSFEPYNAQHFINSTHPLQ